MSSLKKVLFQIQYKVKRAKYRPNYGVSENTIINNFSFLEMVLIQLGGVYGVNSKGFIGGLGQV